MDDPVFRQRLARLVHTGRGTALHATAKLDGDVARGDPRGPKCPSANWWPANRLQDLTERLIEYQDQFGLISDSQLAPGGGRLQRDFLAAPSLRIAGGTDEILKNIIAERVLGLPGDVRVDKAVSFKELVNRG